jgi:hypothetical protein
MARAFVVLSLLTLAVGATAEVPTHRAASIQSHGSEEIEIRFVLTIAEERTPAEGALVLERADGDAGGRVEAAFRQSETRVALPAWSTWRLSVRVPGHWAPAGVVRIDTEPRTISIPLLPTGVVQGRLSVPDAAPDLPDYLYTSLGSPRANAPARRVSGGLFACPIEEDGSFQCELPAELLDLVLRVEGFVPLYRWDVRVREDEPRDLGRIGLDPGSSVAGWAVTEDRTPLPEGAKAYLAPRISGVTDPVLTARLRRGADTRSLGEDGFFQFSGVAPGVYTVVVEAPGYATATVDPIEVLAGDETLLRHPTVLRTPLDLVLQVEPPLDWRGRPWHLVASRASDAGQAFDQRPFFDQAVGDDGRVVHRHRRGGQTGGPHPRQGSTAR